MEYREKKFKGAGENGKKSWKKENAGRNGNNGRNVNGKTERNSGRKETQNFVSGTEKRNGRNYGNPDKSVEKKLGYIDEKLETANDIIENILSYAVKKGLVEDSVVFKDLFDTKLMNCIMPRPSEVINQFNNLKEVSSKDATDYFYDLSVASNYIRKNRTDKNIRFKKFYKYGDIEITINLSKPEKDPKAIALAKNQKSSNYPKCLLCKENVGFAGNVNHPARQNHRIIPLKLNGDNYYFQYSPYVYYNEHCIIFNKEHKPMVVNKETFEHLLSFVEQFPHYLLGSNADLPIVGGSILSHDHYQGGNYEFPMDGAKVFKTITHRDIQIDFLQWPLSTVRLISKNKEHIIHLSEHILNKWINYSNEDIDIISHTEGTRHNTITPIARKVGDTYELDLTLRNNITTEEHPLGVYHPHAEYHHIKKENIGLIEVMGLAVLPARLKGEMELLEEYILEGKDISSNEQIEKHAEWVKKFLPKYPEITKENIHGILQKEIGIVFTHVLEDAGVYKCTTEGREAFMRFLETL